MDQNFNELNNKIIELENRVSKLELINKKRIRNKIIATIVTVVLVLIIGIAYVIIIYTIYSKYLNLF